MSGPIGVGQTFDHDTEFTCPFCGRQAYTVKQPLGLMHAEPACSTFIDLEPDEYLHRVNALLRRRN